MQDKQLLNSLFRIANNKYAQGTPQPDPEINTQILSQLVNNLRRNLNNYTEGDFTSERDDAALNLKNLQSDYQFILFLQSNSILWNNKPLAIAHSPGLPADRQGEQHFEIFKRNGSINPKEYVKYPEPRGGNGDDFRFWINKEGVIEFLRSLYDKSKNQRSGGNLLKVLLDKLVIAINKNSGQPIDPTSKPAPRLPETTEIDKFPNPYELSDPGKQGDVILTLKDINNQDNFKGWLARLPVTQNGTKLFPPTDDENICKVLGSVLKRAKYYVDYNINSDDPLTKQKFDFYYAQIKSFMNANNCNVNTNVPSTNEKPEKSTGTDGDKEPGDRRRTQTSEQEYNLDRLMRTLPLNMQNINFVNIGNFFNNLINWSEGSRDKERYQNYQRMVSSYMGLYKQLLQYPEEIFDLRSEPRDLQAKLKNGSNYMGALEYLRFIVSNTRAALSYLMQVLEANKSLKDEYVSWLVPQIGRGGAGNIASENLERLSALESRVNEAIKISPGRR